MPSLACLTPPLFWFIFSSIFTGNIRWTDMALCLNWFTIISTHSSASFLFILPDFPSFDTIHIWSLIMFRSILKQISLLHRLGTGKKCDSSLPLFYDTGRSNDLLMTAFCIICVVCVFDRVCIFVCPCISVVMFKYTLCCCLLPSKLILIN